MTAPLNLKVLTSNIKMNSEVNTSENVNSEAESTPKLTFHLSQQLKGILRLYAKDSSRQYQQTEIIKALYGEVTPSRKSSVSRSIKTLIQNGLLKESKVHYSDRFSCWFPHRVRFFITEKGEQFVKTEASM